MVAGKDVFRRNGKALSWSSAIAKVDDEEFFGFTGIDYEEKLTRAFARGMDRGGPPRSVTGGQYEVSGGALKGHADSMWALIERVAAKSVDGSSYGSEPFFFALQHAETGIEVTEELHEVYLDGRKTSLAEGPEPNIIEVPLTIIYVKLITPNFPGGLTLFDNRRGRF